MSLPYLSRHGVIRGQKSNSKRFTLLLFCASLVFLMTETQDGTCSLKARITCFLFGHRRYFLAYRQWPHLVVYVCACCGEKTVEDEKRI